MHMRGKTVCKFSVKMKIQVVSIFSKTNRLLYSTTTLESTFRGITVGLALLNTACTAVLVRCRNSYWYLESPYSCTRTALRAAMAMYGTGTVRCTAIHASLQEV